MNVLFEEKKSFEFELTECFSNSDLELSSLTTVVLKVKHTSGKVTMAARHLEIEHHRFWS